MTAPLASIAILLLTAAPPLQRDPHSLTQEEQESDTERMRQTAALTGTWSSEQRQALRELFTAGEAFFLADVTAQEEWYHRVFGQAVTYALDDLLETGRAFESDKDSLPDDMDFATAEREMDATWARLLRHVRLVKLTQLASHLRESQERWERFRDAWGRFGKTRYPETPVASWRTWITRERDGDLRVYIGNR